MKKGSLFLVVLAVLFITTYVTASTLKSPLQIGWAIGYDASNTAVILHTKNGGRKWVAQGNNTEWEGYSGNDISAVDKHTAWAALASNTSSGIGKILHTTNGGVTWTEQTLPEGVQGGIKGIKGLTRQEAWAVSIAGTVLHTTDGGEVWNIVDTGIENVQVNRMDAIGYRDVRDADRSGKNTGKIHSNVWIANEKGGDYGMIHTLYNGDIWRQEKIPHLGYGTGGHVVSAYSARVVWAAVFADGHLYRTADGGEIWESVADLDSMQDFDDMCAYSADALWLVQYQGGYGIIYRVHLEDGEAVIKHSTPVGQYLYEGLTCANDQAAVVVGYTDAIVPPQQRGIILVTNDGGENWENQPLPVDDVSLWKVSFVGARR